eukprot:1091622-Pyramimonas_sp.AAC.1
MAKIAAARYQREYAEIIGHTTGSPQFYEHRAARLQRLASAWSPKNRRISPAGIADADGNAFPTVGAGAQALAARWSRVRASVPSQSAARGQLEGNCFVGWAAFATHQHIMDFGRVSDDFSNSVFLPKGPLDRDGFELWGALEMTRPISLSNSINKIVAVAINCRLKE